MRFCGALLDNFYTMPDTTTTTLLDSWGSGLKNSFDLISQGLVAFVPSALIGVIIFIVGCVVAVWVGKLITQLVNTLKIDDLLRSAKVEDILKRAGVTLHTGRFIGGLVKWYIIVIFLVAFLDVVGLDQINEYLKSVVLGYLPRVIVAVLVLLVGAVTAHVMHRFVGGGAKAAGFSSANFLGSMTKWSILVFAFMVALAQLGVAGDFIRTLFTGVVVALSIAFGLSFGLGGQSAAADFIGKLRKEISDHHHQ